MRALFTDNRRFWDSVCYALLVVVMLAGAWLRFDAQNWDDYTHLHPDERFLTQVVEAINGPLRFTDSDPAVADQLGPYGNYVGPGLRRTLCEQRYPGSAGDGDTAPQPAGYGGYFDAECSALNPNNVGYGLYVYGEFPLFTVHFAGTLRTDLSRDYHAFLETFDPDAAEEHTVTTHWEYYAGAQLVGRSVAALADVLTILVLFLLGRRLYGQWTGLLAAAFYAVAAFPLQQSHFWTVDTFTTLWVTLALYFAVRAMDGASAIQGASPLPYLATWAGAVVWNTAVQGHAVLGETTLGGLFVLTLLATAAVRAWLWAHGWRWGDLLVAASGVIASANYLIGWGVLTLVAPRDFALVGDGLAVGLSSLIIAAVVLMMYLAVRLLRGDIGGGPGTTRHTLTLAGIGAAWMLLVVGLLLGLLATWPVLLIALVPVLLGIFDLTALTDYALFGAALGAAVASRVNVAPLAGVIGLAALVRLLPVLDRRLDHSQRGRIIAYAVTGVMLAAVVSLIVFRVLQPHAFLGPDIWGLRINPGWREDVEEARHLTSGEWDGPPNHQWADRTPYLFPWRNIVLWGLGIPLGMVAWLAWAWAGLSMLRTRPNWTRHLLPFAWILVCFGWLGGRWVMTMRYFLPIYPALALFAAWGLVALVARAWRERRAYTRRPAPAGRAATKSRLAFAGAALLLIGVLIYTALFGVAFHSIHRRQLTRVAASRWFQEHVPGDFGVWVEGDDGTRQMVNLGQGGVATAPQTVHLAQGDTREFPFTLSGEAMLSQIVFPRLSDPARDDGSEAVQVQLFHDDPGQGRQLVYSGTLQGDFSEDAATYGSEVALTPNEPPVLPYNPDPNLLAANYTVQITVQRGPVMLTSNATDELGTVYSHVTLTFQNLADQTITLKDFNFDAQPLLTGHGNDIPITPTHWTVGGADEIAFAVPIQGVVREVEIPHLGDALRDADAETVRISLIAPDGARASVTVTDDFQRGADPLGPPRTLVFDPPLRVDPDAGSYTLLVEAEDPIYTAGPVIAWEGDWDDPIPTAVCPLPEGMIYRDDLPSGLSSQTCGGLGLYGSHYQGIKLWMVAEDNDQKFQAMTNALDQADYVILTSNRFYDSLTRMPMRWPMSEVYYAALFDGRLGFELVKTFESYPELGPFEVPDQILPTNRALSEKWRDLLNDHWEAEEAYHVYDHPAVLLFKKTDAYTAANTRAILNSVSRRPASQANLGYVVDPQPIGQFSWGAKQVSAAPTMLMFPDYKWDIQREGGTWADMFDTGALINQNQVVAVIVWWALMVLVGWLTWPLLFAIFPALPDRGYPVAKLAGWLLVAWVAWFAGTFDVRTWSRGGLLVLLIGLGLLSAALGWRRRAELRAYIRANRRHLLLVEGLTLALFLFFIGIRLGNPDLWHNAFGGEKPMDFAYFNGVLRSTVFPPVDPWFAQGYLNYYYFGYVIVGAPVKLLGVDPALAYNLILPMLYAMTGIGVFSIAYNWVRARKTEPGAVDDATQDRPAAVEALDDPPRRRERRLPAGNAWLAGLLAVLLAVVLGNLGTLHVIVTEVAKLDGWQPQLSLSQQRREELNAQWPTIRAEKYEEVLEDFRDAHGGRGPASPEEINYVNRRADVEAREYIEDEARHPSIFRIWEYGFNNFRDLTGSFFGGMDDMLEGEPFPEGGSHRWHWAPTRIISELPGDAGHNAIAEMPYFTFLYGDLHAHMIAMPVTLFVLLWLLAEIMGAGHGLRTGWESGLALEIGAVAVGVLRPTNSWDWITYLILGAAGLTYAAWLGAVRGSQDRAPSPLVDRLWNWLRPRNARALALLAGGMAILAILARLTYYAYQRYQAHQQLENGLPWNEELVTPSLTITSLLLWVGVGLLLPVVITVAGQVALRAHLDRRILLGWLGRVAAFLLLTFIAALPFTMYFATRYTSVSPWEQHRTPIWAYLYVHGTFIFIVTSLLVWLTARWLRRVQVRELEGRLVPVGGIVIGGLLVFLASLVIGVREVPIAQFVVPLIVWAAVLFFLPRQSPLLRPVYALIVLALAITLGVDLVVLEGDIGRQNTVFKFYLQVWLMLSVVGGVGLAWMLRRAGRWPVGLRTVWQGGLAILLAIAALYPLLATQARFLDRFNREDTPLTLDGMDYMQYAVHGENGVWFSLESEYDLIRWMQENIAGTPVVMEAHLFPPLYHWSARISIYTGLPTVLGWDWHQQQQRTLPGMNAMIRTRQNNIAAFYELPGEQGIEAARNLIDTYDIEYIVLGVLERVAYDDIRPDPATGNLTPGHAEGLAKFAQMEAGGLLEVVYERPVCLMTTVERVEDCPPESVYMDRVYRVVPYGERPERATAQDIE
jgi:uncharacterized membrane protein